VAQVNRVDDYLPLRDYALIGDGQTSALVGRDGAIDWLCLPKADSPPLFDRILDAADGGAFELSPNEPFEATRRYREGTNVLETTFTTGSGVVRLTDAMTVSTDSHRCLVRMVDGLEGQVPMRWRFEPRFDFGRGAPDDAAFDLRSWDTGNGAFRLGAGAGATFVLTAPAAHVSREDAERAVERTSAAWMDWAGQAEYEGPWRDQVVRSALVLKLLTFAPSGAILAAPTTSLPERRCQLGLPFRLASRRHLHDARAPCPRLSRRGRGLLPLADGSDAPHDPRGAPALLRRRVCRIDEEELDLPGYRDSRPVRVGNAAADQLQLDNYGHLLESAARVRPHVVSLGTDSARQLAAFADFVETSWREPDAGIWEVRDGPYDFVQSKAMCWTALDRAAKLAELGALPDRAARWRRAADEVRAWIETEGWDD
jgi:GH15 family glucan-1,4-alpha-glucosidase